MNWLGRPRIDLASCVSSNDEAARLARVGATHGTIVIADTQTGGRGRMGRTWSSPPGGNLYLSCVLRPPLALPQTPALALAIGIAVCDAIRSFGAPAMLKWPNDILVEGRKAAGILLEAQSQGSRLESLIAGIGVNLSAPIPLELEAVATSLSTVINVPVSRDAFVAVLLTSIETWVDRYVACGLAVVVDAWNLRMQPDLAVRAGKLIGVAQRVDSDGNLRIRDGAGVLHTIAAGDVEIVRRVTTPSTGIEVAAL
jgi:BirA family transcriptional regulator, biotin operon repressor / biotin---[acetyl-CoA-carboxylase] ligase